MLCLVDTSVWIDFFRGKATEKSKILHTLINQGVDLSYTGVILTEVLLGFKSDTDLKIGKGLFENLIYLEADINTYLLASEIYRTARRSGITIRSTVDCIISAVALEQEAILLENDKDFLNIKKFYDLKLVRR